MLRGVSLDMLDLDDLSSLGVPSRDRDVSLLGVPHRVASCDVTSLLPTLDFTPPWEILFWDSS